MASCCGLMLWTRLPGRTSNIILAKLEGNNPAGSVKDRPALSMIQEAERKGVIKPGDTLIEATSGNTGIALAMAAAIKGYKLILIMPANMSEERRAAMAAYGAELLSVPPGEMETARDLAKEMEAEGKGIVLDQFGNLDNPLAHFTSTGPELWEQTNGQITHLVSSMGTTGTIMGTSRYLKSKNPKIQLCGLQPSQGAKIPGIRRWPEEYLPKIFDRSRVDQVIDISQREAEETTRALARMEGIFCGVSSGGAVSAALRLSSEVENAVIAVIICDRGDRYLSTGIFSPQAIENDPKPCPANEFPSAVARLPAYPAPRYVIFVADPDPETGESWCGDTNRALPIARELVREAGGTLLEVAVGSRPVWKDEHHPFRHDPELHLTCVPTMIHWQDGAPGERVGPELEAAKTSSLVETTLRSFISRTAGK
ncbi:unnamed protein product [Ostreobium quekettii]|uniref:Cysteine synthase n=1 Tax=Ostreobium quekettii TaxID=121088 RepID=A0A8S1J7J2_9CHLO|nr:unnamed protein product [Ostreobium quekettii]